ncbi:MAG TPA: hypothetical protein VLL94_07915 [Nitrospiraceae bacterium]|nr:hypothetical protein [Nitrospiraceae bacterium]
MTPSSQQSLFPTADPRFTVHASRFRVSLNLILLALLCVVSTACGTAAPTGKILFQDPRGTVSLQTIPDQSIQATHPIKMDPTLLAQLLKGIEIQYQERGIQKFLAGTSAPVPVFSDDQIQFLAPLLAEGLRTASPSQRVEFRAETTHKGSMLESSTTETTAGSLYAYGRQLYFILSQYRYSPSRINIDLSPSTQRSRPVDYTGLQNHILLFTNSAAQRPDAFDPPTGGKPTDKFLAIDYKLLEQAWRNLEAKRQAAPQMESGTVSVNESVEALRAAEARVRAAEAQVRNTEALTQEVELLKKQLESIQKQLGSQPTGQTSPK